MKNPKHKPTLRLRRRVVVIGLVAAMIAGFFLIRQSSNTIVLGSSWSGNSLYPIEQFDHSKFDQLLQKYVNQKGQVDYASWQQNEEDKIELLDYLLSTSRIHWNRDRTPHTEAKNRDAIEKAFWINAYNAMTIHAVLSVYPTESIRRHTNPIGFNLWRHYKLNLGTRVYSLRDIENGPLKNLGDGRVHFAIVKASVGSPNLRSTAYQPEQLDQQLDQQAAAFLANPSHLEIEGTSRVHLSPVLKSVLAEFEGDQHQQLVHLAKMVPDPEIRQSLTEQPLKITWLKHDWSLNQQR